MAVATVAGAVVLCPVAMTSEPIKSKMEEKMSELPPIAALPFPPLPPTPAI